MTPIRQTAIQWFLRIQHIGVDHPDRAKFETWLYADIAHQKAYSEVETVWSNLDSPTDVKQLTSALAQHKLTGAKKIKTATAILSIIVTFSLGLLGYQTWHAQPVMQVAATAQIGQLKSQTLVDGTKMILNANTDLEVTYYRDKRCIELKQGEVILEVARDEDRPFIVESGKARITVLGTRFVVNRLKHLVRVSVDHGRVQVHAHQPIDTATSDIILSNGEVAEIKEDALLQRVDKNAADAFSFENGLIAFKDADLKEIAETLSRYRTTPVEASQRHDNAHVTALIKTKNIEKFIQNLPQIAPVEIKTMDGITTLTAASAAN